MRERGLAQALIDLYGGTTETCLAELCRLPPFADLDLHDASDSGSRRALLTELPGYRPRNPPNPATDRDLGCLPFDSGSLDLVITTDIFEYSPDPEAAFREIRRVLRAEGRHVFALRQQHPTSPTPPHKVRARLGGRGPLFGANLLADLARMGMRTVARFPDATNIERRKVVVFVSRAPS